MPRKLDKKGLIELDVTGLKSAHIRTIKTLHNLMVHVLTTENESEYFNHSAESIRLCASLMKQAHFIEMMREKDIPYAEQVLEFSVDILQDYMANFKVISYDC